MAQRAAAFDVQSATGALHDLYERHRDDIDPARAALAAVPRQIGAMVWISGEWRGLDLFATAKVFDRVWPRLCTGYAADGLDAHPAGALTPAPRVVLDGLLAAIVAKAGAVALGQEYRIADARIHGAALVADDRLVHLMAFPARS